MPEQKPREQSRSQYSEDLSFQVMPGESADLSDPVDISVDSATPVEAYHGNHKVIYIVISILILLALGALAYFLLGPNAQKPETAQTTQKLPPVFLKQHFNVETCQDQSVCGDDADPDSDGLSNYDEFRARGGADPKNNDTDGDGLADGDEVHVYKTEPAFKFSYCRGNTGLACQYDDGSQIKNGYDPATPGIKMTETRKQQIETDTQTFKLHEPTKTTLNMTVTPPPASTGSNSSTPATNSITIQNDTFVPATLTINRGQTVTWVNKDQVNHYVASDPHPQHTALPGFDSGAFAPNATYLYTFDKAGTFTYHDHLQPTSKGTIIVK
ncbi:MAG TPA: cupredoxin domain-containing protein [Verrucomicrobiae bacterium]|nr:cupredoxin domain-containing protein [Verrucomicrobiae bacterium]